MLKHIVKAYEYIKEYERQQQTHPEFIDYYELFQLNPISTMDEIYAEIKTKKIRASIHPESIGHIEARYHESYLSCIKILNQMDKDFSTRYHRDMYDKKLKELKEKHKQDSKHKKKNTENKKKSDDKSTKEEEKEKKDSKKDSKLSKNKAMQIEKSIESAIETTIYQYGFYNGYRAIVCLLHDDFSHITRENNARGKVKEVGNAQIKNFITSRRKNILDSDIDNIAMDYFCEILDKAGLRERSYIFYDACKITSKQKESTEMIEDILYDYIYHDDISGFSSDVREELEKSGISGYDAHTLILAKLHENGQRKKNEGLLFTNIVDDSVTNQISLFANEIVRSKTKSNSSKK